MYMCAMIIEKEVMNFTGVERKQVVGGRRRDRNYLNTVNEKLIEILRVLIGEGFKVP